MISAEPGPDDVLEARRFGDADGRRIQRLLERAS